MVAFETFAAPRTGDLIVLSRADFALWLAFHTVGIDPIWNNEAVETSLPPYSAGAPIVPVFIHLFPRSTTVAILAWIASRFTITKQIMLVIGHLKRGNN
jgi:hypothetical protein